MLYSIPVNPDALSFVKEAIYLSGRDVLIDTKIIGVVVNCFWNVTSTVFEPASLVIGILPVSIIEQLFAKLTLSDYQIIDVSVRA